MTYIRVNSVIFSLYASFGLDVKTELVFVFQGARLQGAIQRTGG